MIFEYKVRARHRLGWKEFKLYADTDIEEFFNRNSIDYVRNLTDTVENKQQQEIERLNNIINELKLCNSDYKNQICTLSSKLERINEYISNSKRELSVDSYYKFKDLSEFDDIKEIIFDKTIKVGSDKNNERKYI